MAEPLQIDRIRQIEQEMRSLMVSTDRCNRELAESAVKALYKAHGRNAPETFIWFSSPLTAAPAAMLCALAESAKMQLDSVGSAAHAQLKINDPNWHGTPPVVELWEPDRKVTDSKTYNSAPLDSSLFPLTSAWRGWLGNMDLNEHSICFARRIVQISQYNQNESRGAYGTQMPRLFLSVANVQRTISRAVRVNLTRKMIEDPSLKFFDETIEYLNNETFNSPFSGELTRVVETLKRLSTREQQFVLECLFNFMIDAPTGDDTIIRFRFGQHDVDAANRLVVGKLVGLPLGSDPELLTEIARTCGWWCPMANICIMVDRPTEIHFDNKDLLHSTDGPACRYEDGWGFFALGGIQVAMTAALGQFELTEINEEFNVERRRVMIERYGMEKYLQDSGATPVSEDECGRLFRMRSGMQDEHIQIVEVRNSTPEPDDTYKMYYLRVPPHINSAREAVAWTFGLDQEEYTPIKES